MKFRKQLSVVVAVFLMMCLPLMAEAKVSVVTGPTPIPSGDANDPGDITVKNNKFAISINAKTPGPWGAPHGGIMDGAVIRADGSIDPDRLAWVDILPNSWSEWVPTYAKVKVVKDTPEEAVIAVSRDWQGLEVESTYVIKDNDDKVALKTTIINKTDKEIKDVHSGFCLWNNGGYPLTLVGLTEETATKFAPVEGALADWFVNYDENWGTALHAPYATNIDYEGRDLLKLVKSLKPGESLELEGWLQMLPDGSLTPVLDWDMARHNLRPGVVSGAVATSAGEKVETPVVVVKKEGKIYAWAQGSQAAYELRLPEGDYELYASGKNYGPGQTVKVSVKAGEKITQNFNDVELPATVSVVVKNKADGKPLDARFKIESGYTPEVRYLGQKMFFTREDKIGQAELQLAAGKYGLAVSHGAGFLNEPTTLNLDLKPAEKINQDVLLDMTYQPSAQSWYGGDMHHHSNVLDGNTEPEMVSIGQLARGLDVVLLSDHDSAVNHARAATVAQSRNKPFIPAIEISPSWAHFNAIGVPMGQVLANPNNLKVQEIFDDARQNKASLLMVNHPFHPGFGYFQALEDNRAPGGNHDDYDLVEFNSANLKQAAKVIPRMHEIWNKGRKVYLASGTDYHDLLVEDYPEVRTMVHVDSPLTAEKYIEGLKAGHSYITLGPLVYPEIMFGDEAAVKEGQEISFKVESAKPFTTASFVYNGEKVQSQTFDPPARAAELKFKVPAKAQGWVNLEIGGPNDEGFLWTNPIWIK